MVGAIIFNIIAFILFVYIFLFKLIKKNDTSYLVSILLQTLGILINFIQILFSILNNPFFYIINYLLCVVFPLAIIILEMRGFCFNEIVYINLSKIHLLFNNNKKAKELLINLLTKNKNSYKGHKMLAEIYEKEGGMRRAIDEYVKALDINGKDYKAYFKISILLNDLNKKDEAIQMLKNLLNKKPDIYEASMLLGELLYEKKKYKDAIGVYTKALRKNEGEEKIYYELGLSYSRINEFPLAKECFKKAIEINNDFYDAYYKLGQIALLYRDIEKAEVNFNQSIYGDKEVKAYYQLAKIEMIKNNRSKATININRAIKIDSYYYKKAIEEPIFFAIKKMIERPSIINEKPDIVQTEKEKSIEE